MPLNEYEIGTLLEEKYWEEFSGVLDLPWKKVPLPPSLVDKFYAHCTCGINSNVELSLRNIGVVVYAGQCTSCRKIFWAPNFD